MEWVRRLFSRRRRYQDLSISIQEHLEEKADELMEQGMSREEAMQAARRAFGNVGLIEERSREEWIWPELEGLRADLKYALRQLWKHPAFSLTAILTLTLGIGANVVVFSVLNALIVRPLNVSDPQQLYNVEHKQHGWYTQSYPDYLDYRDRNRTFDGMRPTIRSVPHSPRVKRSPRTSAILLPATTSTCWAFSLCWVASFTRTMSMGRIRPLISS